MKTSTRLIFFTFIGLFLIGTFLWNWELLFQKKTWWMNHGGELENIFSPFNAVLSGLGILGVVLSIVYQIASFKTQQFENVFFNLLTIHCTNKKELKYNIPQTSPMKTPIFFIRNNPTKNALPTQEQKHNDDNPFRAYYELLNALFRALTIETIELEQIQVDHPALDTLNDRIAGYRNDKGHYALKPAKAIELACKTFDEITNFALFPYFVHLYRTLKYTKDEAPRGNKDYTKILRAQLSEYEFALLYYNALVSDDRDIDQVESKFKKLIESTTFFHTFKGRENGLLFSYRDLPEYHDSAFNEQPTEWDNFISFNINYLSKHYLNDTAIKSYLGTNNFKKVPIKKTSPPHF